MKWQFKSTSTKLSSLSPPQRNPSACLWSAQRGISPLFLALFPFPSPFTPESPHLLLPPRLMAGAWAAQPCQRWPSAGSPRVLEAEAFPLDHTRPQVSKMPGGLSCCWRCIRTGCPQVVFRPSARQPVWSEDSQSLGATLAVTYRLLFCLSFSSVKWE